MCKFLALQSVISIPAEIIDMSGRKANRISYGLTTPRTVSMPRPLASEGSVLTKDSHTLPATRSIAAMTPCPISLSWFSLKRGLLMGVGKPPWGWGVIWTGCSLGCKESYKDLDNSPCLHIT